MFHQSKGLFHHLAWFCFHCPFCSTWYCIWYSPRWTFTEWGQGSSFVALFLLLNYLWMTLGSPVCAKTPYWNFFVLSPDFGQSCVKIVQVSCYPNPLFLPVSAFSFVVFIHQGLWSGRCQKVLQLVFVVESCRSQMCSPAPFSRHSENRFLVARAGWSQDGAQSFLAQSRKHWDLQESCPEIHSSLNMFGAITIVREVSYLFNPKVIFSFLGKGFYPSSSPDNV